MRPEALAYYAAALGTATLTAMFVIAWLSVRVVVPCVATIGAHGFPQRSLSCVQRMTTTDASPGVIPGLLVFVVVLAVGLVVARRLGPGWFAGSAQPR